MNTGRLGSSRHDLRDVGVRLGNRSDNRLLFGAQNQAPNAHTGIWVPSNVKVDRGTFTQYAYEEVNLFTNMKAELSVSYADGCIPMLIIGVANVFLANVVPATYGKKAREIIEEMRAIAPGQPYYYVSLINEPYNCGEKGSNASDYAKLCKAVYEECEAHGIPLWPAAGGVMISIYAHLTYQLKTSEKVAGAFSDYTTGGGWMRDFVAAWPGSVTKVNAFEIHPYGEPVIAATAEGNNNIASGKLQREQSIAAGFTLGGCPGINNWWVGEVGYNVGGAGVGKVATNAEQASKLKEALEQMYGWYSEGWLKCINVFADGLTEWGIWGKEAQATLESFAKAH